MWPCCSVCVCVCLVSRVVRAKPIYPLSWTGRVAIPVCECASLNFDARSPPSRLQVARKSPRPACCSSWWAVSGYFTITSRSQPSQAYLYLVRRPQVVLRSCSVPMPPLHGREHPTLSRRRKLGLIPFPAHLPHRCHPVGILDSRPLRGPSVAPGYLLVGALRETRRRLVPGSYTSSPDTILSFILPATLTSWRLRCARPL